MDKIISNNDFLQSKRYYSVVIRLLECVLFSRASTVVLNEIFFCLETNKGRSKGKGKCVNVFEYDTQVADCR